MISVKEIIQLNAGREMDILVSEQVMGWQIETDESKLKKLKGFLSRDGKHIWWRTPEGAWHCDPPSYSSDMTAAWQVVEKMKIKGQVLFLSQGSGSGESKIAFDEARTTSPNYITERSTTEGICKAALIAVRTGRITQPLVPPAALA